MQRKRREIRRRFPWVRPRRTPKVGQKYELRHLQPLARQLFERLAELQGIPVKELLPWREKGSRLYPEYNPKTHAIEIRSYSNPHTIIIRFFCYLIAGPKTSPTQHEAIHAIANILGSKGRLKEEVHASAGAHSFLHILPTTGEPIKSFRLQRKINGFYRKYGADGLLALLLHLPSASHIERYERELVKQEILSKNGFTEKGTQWFRRRAKKEAIEKRLEEMKTTRKERGLPA